MAAVRVAVAVTGTGTGTRTTVRSVTTFRATAAPGLDYTDVANRRRENKKEKNYDQFHLSLLFKFAPDDTAKLTS